MSSIRPRRVLLPALSPEVDERWLDTSGRIINHFGDTRLAVDISFSCDRSKIWERDLSTVTLSMWGAGAASQTTVPMLSVKFAPYWAYLAIAAELERTEVETRLRHCVSGAFNGFHRFVTWLARRGVTDLSSVKRSDTDELLRELLVEGAWGQLLGVDKAYGALLNRIEASKDPVAEIAKFASCRKNSFSFSEGRLTELLGFPVHNGQVPQIFVEKISRILRTSRNQGKCEGISGTGKALSRRTLRGVLTQINNLARVGDPADGRFGLDFVPYSDPHGLVVTSVKRLPDSFQNIALEDVIALLKECRTWIDDYSDGIVKLYAQLGQKLGDLSTKSGCGYASHALSMYAREISPVYEQEYGIPAIEFPWRGSSRSVSALVRTLQAACAATVLLNHGRRHNEVLGEGELLYGLYEGCVARYEQDGVVRYELRIYIEKTVRRWVTMSANAGVARAVEVLEKLLRTGRGVAKALGSPAHRLRATGEGNAKLFQAVPLCIVKGRDRLPSMFIWHDHSRWLLQRARVDPKHCGGQAHPFRRMFAQVYYYRYENADIRALSQWMGHTSIASTLIYVTDPASRENAERIEARCRQSNEAIADDIRAFGREYLSDCLMRLLEGHPSGGGFTALALRVFRAMSSRANFPEDITSRAKLLAAWFTERGYEPEPNPHAACMAGENTLSRARSKCFDPARKQLNKHEASPVKCSGCPHAYVNNGYLESDRDELKRLDEMTNDSALPARVRDGARTSAQTLRRVIAIEQKLQDGNLERMHSIYEEIARRLGGTDA